jgi:hypothetical protein
MPYNPKKNGAANYKSWMQLTAEQISAIEAAEGADNTSDPNAERFAQVVHVANQSTSSVDDGTVSMKELSPYKVEVKTDPTPYDELTYISYKDDALGPVTIVRISVEGDVTTWEKATSTWALRADGGTIYGPING